MTPGARGARGASLPNPVDTKDRGEKANGKAIQGNDESERLG
jgi:hypothetical protein